jgi:hypothetical protein
LGSQMPPAGLVGGIRSNLAALSNEVVGFSQPAQFDAPLAFCPGGWNSAVLPGIWEQSRGKRGDLGLPGSKRTGLQCSLWEQSRGRRGDLGLPGSTGGLWRTLRPLVQQGHPAFSTASGSSRAATSSSRDPPAAFGGPCGESAE